MSQSCHDRAIRARHGLLHYAGCDSVAELYNPGIRPDVMPDLDRVVRASLISPGGSCRLQHGATAIFCLLSGGGKIFATPQCRAQHWQSHIIHSTMKAQWVNVTVDDQNKALAFYTGKLGFVLRDDIKMGPTRWLSVVSPHDPDGVQVVLQDSSFPGSAAHQHELFTAAVPAVAFHSDDVDAEFKRLKELGVVFRGEPWSMGAIKAVLFEDTCGNLINLVHPAR